MFNIFSLLYAVYLSSPVTFSCVVISTLFLQNVDYLLANDYEVENYESNYEANHNPAHVVLESIITRLAVVVRVV